MANETELANIIKQTDTVSAMKLEAFTTTDNVWPLIYSEAFDSTTNVKKFRKGGKLEVANGTESTGYTFGSDSEVTESSVTVTGTRKEVAAKLTLEQLAFSGAYQSLEDTIKLAFQGFARKAAGELKTLFSSLSGSVTASTTLTKDALLDARYIVASGVKNATLSPRLVGYFDYKGMNELAKELTSVSASAFSNQVDLGGVLGIATGGKPKGELFDIVLFETDGLPTDTGDDVAAVWDPAKCFCAGVMSSQMPEMWIKNPSADAPWYEIYMATFWAIAELADAAGTRVRSDT